MSYFQYPTAAVKIYCAVWVNKEPTLAQIKESDGEITEAANILQELQVETYGSMERREKVGF